jgi:uncharacterized protein with HEPN domain
MRRDQRDPAFLADMLRFALEVVELTNGVSLEAYQGSLQIRRATERSIELIGEAARRVSETTKETITEIAWRNIIGLRILLVHEYGNINDPQLWEAATVDVPRLVEQLRRLLQ